MTRGVLTVVESERHVLTATTGGGVLTVTRPERHVLTAVAQGPQGPQGTPGGGGTYTHTEASPATTWTVVHNLGFYPNVMVLDASQRRIVPEIDHVNTNQLTVNHATAYAGTAICS